MHHEEYDLMIRAPFNSSPCVAPDCITAREFALSVQNDHGEIVRRWSGLCGEHLLTYIFLIASGGWEKVRSE